MKQKILDALKTKFSGVSDTILSRIAEKTAKTVTTEDAVQGAVDAITFQQVVESESDRRATEATQSAIVNYEKKHGLKDGQKATGEEPDKTDPNKKTPPATGGEITAETITAAVAAAMKPLQDEINALKTGKVTGERKQKLDAVIDKLPGNLKKPYSRIQLTDMSEDEFNTFITETTAEVEELATELTAKGAVIKTPMGGGSGNPPKKEASKEEALEVLKGIL
jgi:glutamate dehydrogenase/leucine dehydrogenase